MPFGCLNSDEKLRRGILFRCGIACIYFVLSRNFIDLTLEYLKTACIVLNL